MNKDKTKRNRKVNLVSSHSDNEHNDYGPLLVCDNNGPALSEIYKDRLGEGDLESRLRYKPRPGETVIEETLYIPDVDHG